MGRKSFWNSTKLFGSKSVVKHKRVVSQKKDYNLTAEKSPTRGFVIQFKDERKVFTIFTDASEKNGRTGIGIHFPTCPENDVSQEIYNCDSIEVAEVEAIQPALDITLTLNDNKNKQIKVYTDRLSMIESLQKYCSNTNFFYDLSPHLQKLVQTILKLESGVILKHVYAHESCGGNKKADELARAASGLKPSSNSRANPPDANMLTKTRSVYIRHYEPYASYEYATVQHRSQFEVDEWMSSQQASVEGRDIPRPVFEFNECGFPGEIESLLYGNFKKPTVIQSISWPVAMSGHNIILKSPNGTGKSLAYIIPAILYCLEQTKSISCTDGPIALILLTTIDMVKQVEKVARSFCLAMRISCTNLLCDNSLNYGSDIFISTPHRFSTFPAVIEMKRCSYLVLDEADYLFQHCDKDIEKIIEKICREDCQILMSSATWSRELYNFAVSLINDPVTVNIGPKELFANPCITQKIEVIKEYRKQQRLINLLKNEINEKAIVFFNSKQKITELHEELQKIGRAALCIHGDIDPKKRDLAINEFKEGKIAILLATDIAARGLDLNDVKYVVNYDYPNNSEDYVHRIGRTARGNNSGISYTFFTQQNGPKARDLIKVLEEAKQVIPEELQKFAKF